MYNVYISRRSEDLLTFQHSFINKMLYRFGYIKGVIILRNNICVIIGAFKHSVSFCFRGFQPIAEGRLLPSEGAAIAEGWGDYCRKGKAHGGDYCRIQGFANAENQGQLLPKERSIKHVN